MSPVVTLSLGGIRKFANSDVTGCHTPPLTHPDALEPRKTAPAGSSALRGGRPHDRLDNTNSEGVDAAKNNVNSQSRQGEVAP